MKKLYETDSYIKECDTYITDCRTVGDKTFISIADSIFFPEEGGQYADTGVIECNGQRFDLLNGLLIQQNSASSGTDPSDPFALLPQGVWYLVDYAESCRISCNNLPPLTDILVINAKIRCFLDFDKRFDRMQNHSGEHVLTGMVHNDYGYDNVGFHLSDDGPVTLDLNGPLTYAQAIEMEEKANAIIYANMPISDSYPSKEELKCIEYRSKKDIEGQVRLITIGDKDNTVDICACCAPHVARTGEIGIIKVLSVINWKGGVRISILCGRRALKYINKRQDIINGLTGLLTTSEDNLIAMNRTHIEEINSLKRRLSSAMEDTIVNKIMQGDKEIEQTHMVFADGDIPQATLKNIYNLLKNKYSGYVGIFNGNDDIGYRFLAGSKDIDSKTLIPILSAKGVKCGGSSDMIQGRSNLKKSELIAVIIGLRSV